MLKKVWQRNSRNAIPSIHPFHICADVSKAVSIYEGAALNAS